MNTRKDVLHQRVKLRTPFVLGGIDPPELVDLAEPPVETSEVPDTHIPHTI